ncbi:MAG: GNAT family N-acetyltransferase, partial [Candidatus Aminicenantes bacterium]|nr:GNAT family N-acetyltransferase [Candidatus Aminicenantes bacterium]
MRIEKISTLEKLIEVRGEWNTLLESSSQNCVFLSNEWFCAWFESFGESYPLCVLLFRDHKNRLFGAAPLMETCEGQKFIASQEVTDYCDFIVERGKEELFYINFLEYWQKENWQNSPLLLENIREGSPTLSILSRMADEHQLENSVRESDVALSLDLPLTYEEYLKNLVRKNRHELQRKKRKIDSLSGVFHKRVNDPVGVRNYIDLFIDMHGKRSSSKRKFWHKKGMVEFFRTITALFSENGWIEFNAVHFQDEPAAILLNFIYHDEIHFYNIAFEPKYSPFSPGIYLFNQSIRQAIEDKLRRADFLRGREKYKYY